MRIDNSKMPEIESKNMQANNADQSQENVSSLFNNTTQLVDKSA